MTKGHSVKLQSWCCSGGDSLLFVRTPHQRQSCSSVLTDLQVGSLFAPKPFCGATLRSGLGCSPRAARRSPRPRSGAAPGAFPAGFGAAPGGGSANPVGSRRRGQAPLVLLFLPLFLPPPPPPAAATAAAAPPAAAARLRSASPAPSRLPRPCRSSPASAAPARRADTRPALSTACRLPLRSHSWKPGVTCSES